MRHPLKWLVGVLLAVAPLAAAEAQAPSFIEFESGQVRPLALSPDGTRLFAVNTPNNTLEIFQVTSGGLAFQARVPVGLEPVAVAARSDSEVWVVNHLSDSVSVVSLTGTPRVVRTLLVGDEPRDIVFAGKTPRAFITTAHRGQHRTNAELANVSGAGDPKFTTPGVGRADVWVFDPANLGGGTGGIPLKVMTFFADTPRALAVSPDKATVYVAAFRSGNQTTVINSGSVCDGFTNQPCLTDSGDTAPGGNPGPATNAEGKQAPETALIVKYNNATGKWEDELKRDWSALVRFNLPDLDVFAVDAARLSQKATYAHVGTTLFNMATNPVSGKVYVSNTEAFNHVRFEGPGVYGGHTVQGHLAETRVTVLSGSLVLPRHLNKHLDYTKLAGSAGFDATAKQHSLANPTDVVVSADGTKLYVAAMGSSKVGVFDTKQLEDDTFDPRTASAGYIPVSGGGPTGLVLDGARNRLYVMTRFDNAVKVVDLGTRAEVAAASLPNPEPASVVAGRPMLYDANVSSANGETSCASCHIFGDTDELAWDLGNPDDVVTFNPLDKVLTSPTQISLGKSLFGVATPVNGSDNPDEFHPMKGPMTTQTLRGLVNSGAMHWRGDRANGFFGIDKSDARLSFKNFIVAFSGLLGRVDLPATADMERFTDFQLQVQLPPNPVRNLDSTWTAAQQRGRDFYFGSRPSDGINAGGLILGQSAFTCNGCHTVNASQGFFGTNQKAAFDGITQIMKIPHLRNMYQKVGMFGMAKVDFFQHPDSGWMGDQIRGYGFTNEGSVDTMFRFFSAVVFQPQLNAGFPLLNPDATRRDVEQFMLAMETDLAPIVGQQVTLTGSNASTAGARVSLLVARAKATFVSKALGGTTRECDLVATMPVSGGTRSYLLDPTSGNFVPNDGTSVLSDASLRALAAPGQEVTYTCVPPGSGSRIAYGQ